MTRIAYDSTNIADDPAGAQLVLYYCDGEFATTEAAVRARFPNAIPVAISAIGTDSGVMGDCEPGCMTAQQLVNWVVRRRAAGVDPTGYVYDSEWAAVRAAFHAAGVPEPHWFESHFDGIPVLTPGTVGKQYENSAMTGGHFDKSVVADFWPGVDSAAGAATGDDMFEDPDRQTLNQADDILTGKRLSTKALDQAVIDLQKAAALGNNPDGTPTAVWVALTKHFADVEAAIAELKADVAKLQAPTVTVPTQITFSGTGSLHS